MTATHARKTYACAPIRPVYTTFTCEHPTLCDDGNRCTNDLCTVEQCDQATCDFPCLSDCTACPGGFCDTCACVQESCSVLLKEITFQDAHTVYAEAPPCDPAGTCWGAGVALTGVDWSSVSNPDHPVVHTRGTSMTLVVRMDVAGGAPGTAVLRMTGPDGVTGSGTFSVPCRATEERFITITTSALPNMVKAYTPAALSWSVQCPGDTIYRAVGSTSHRLYVTLGPPPGDHATNGNSRPTNRRMNFVCRAAAQAATPLEAIEGAPFGGQGIHNRLDANPPQDGCPSGTGAACVDDWRLLASWPYRGECDEQAHLMNLALRLVGLGPGREYLLRASTDANVEDVECKTAGQLGIADDLDGEGQTGDETLCLYFDFDPPNGAINFFEGTLEMFGNHYAVWPSLKADTGCLLLKALGDRDQMVLPAKQFWMYIPGVTGEAGAGSVHIHPPEVPFPTCP